MDEFKIFRDPIYGYIRIDKKYCIHFIDTDIFQRLRRIEQTSMRILYPSAHHDRFAHSIGVFHLGQIAFLNLKNNSRSGIIDSEEDWKKYQVTFEIACLLHDCGHSPFSHTFEFLYMQEKKNEKVRNELYSFFDRNEFDSIFAKKLPPEHELISALVMLKKFSRQIEEVGGDPLLAARMIMGFKHHKGILSSKQHFENRLISLLNGSAFDIDSLDYTQRDSWASGVSNVEIDYQRLLSALMIKEDKYNIPRIAFKKSALSVLENISIGRNFLYKWIYNHHIVLYEQYILVKIIKIIDQISEGKFCEKVFSIDSFFDTVKFGKYNFYLPADDDLLYTIKSFSSHGIPEIDEYLTRNYRYKALWKTHFELNSLFPESVNIQKIMGAFTNGELDDTYHRDSMIWLEASPKEKGISNGEMFIDIDGELVDAVQATSFNKDKLAYPILYVQAKPDLRKNKSDIIRHLLRLQK